MELPEKHLTIGAVRMFDAPFRRGPWKTKSEGTLNVTLALPREVWPWIQRDFPNYDSMELARIGNGLAFDVRGFRVYTVEGLPAGAVGGTEFHRIRKEIIITSQGDVEWEFEDLTGVTHELHMPAGRAFYMPAFIRHTYTVTEEGSGLVVVCNTLFDPDDPRSHDTYNDAQFRELKEALLQRRNRG